MSQTPGSLESPAGSEQDSQWHQTQQIVVDEDEGRANTHNDTDSALGDDDESAYSASLASSIYSHVYENGRRYNSYREGSYLSPNDEDEQDRLDLHHHIWRLMLRGALYTAPIKSPHRVLDIGTGTGIWAIEMADDFPAAVVTGTDISPIQPAWVPPNCHFYMDDAESPWVFKEPFDYIHCRALGGAIGNWKQFHQELFRNTKPGGWVEMQEFEASLASDDNTIPMNSWVTLWTDEMDRASTIFGKNYNAAPLQKQLMIDAGFVNVKDEVLKAPVGTWPKDKRMKEIGRFMQANMFKSVDNYTPAPFTRVLGYTMEQTQVTMERIKQELRDRSIHSYATYHFVIGQKPEEAG